MNNTERKSNQIKALRNSNGLQYLVNAGGRILGNPIYIHNVEYQRMVYTEDIVTDDPLWNEMISAGAYSRETLELFKDGYFIDAIANAESVTALTSEKLKYDRILGKILNKRQILVACANMVVCKQPLAEGDLPAFKLLCQKIGRVINKESFYQLYGEKNQAALINALIDGCIEDKRLYSHSVAEIYQGLRNYIYIAVADTPPEHFLRILRQRYPALKCAPRNDNMVIIASADDTCPDESEDMQKLQKLAQKHQVRLGISSSFENLFQLQEYYAQACATLCGQTAKTGCRKGQYHS